MKKYLVLSILTISFMLTCLSPVHAQNNPRNTYDVKPGGLFMEGRSDL